MTDISEYLSNGGEIQYLPEMPVVKHFKGNIQQELIRMLQLGDKTFNELAYLGDRRTIISACSRIRQSGSPVTVYKDTITLDNPHLEAKKLLALKAKSHNFTEQKIIQSLGKFFLRGKYLLAVNNFYWTGYECDFFCISNDFKPIEFEIKVSRKDFLLDAKKDKWQKPVTAWKHYYLMPDSIFNEDMAELLPHPNSGILTIVEAGNTAKIFQKKSATANKNVKSLDMQTLANVARLVSMRLWCSKQEIIN